MQVTTHSPSLEEFLQLPETKPASEFIDGKISQKPMPQGIHSLLQYKLCLTINELAEKTKIAFAFPELRCVFGGNVLVPDVAVFRWQRIPRNASGRLANRFEIHPDWSIEILSPEQSQTRVLKNLLHCSEHGTELGWLIYPEDEMVLVVLPEQKVQMIGGNDSLPILEGIDLELTAAQVFAWLNIG